MAEIHLCSGCGEAIDNLDDSVIGSDGQRYDAWCVPHWSEDLDDWRLNA